MSTLFLLSRSSFLPFRCTPLVHTYSRDNGGLEILNLGRDNITLGLAYEFKQQHTKKKQHLLSVILFRIVPVAPMPKYKARLIYVRGGLVGLELLNVKILEEIYR